MFSLDELVQDGVNGLVFHDAEQLAAQFEVHLVPSHLRLFYSIVHYPFCHPQTLLESHPSSPQLKALRSSLQGGEWSTWAQNWDRVVRPLVLRDVSGESHVER